MTTLAAAPAVDVVDHAVAAIGRGRPVVLHGGSQGAVLVAAAAGIDPATVAFLVRYGSGFLEASAPEALLDVLDLPPAHGRSARTVPFDAASGVSTGISATDRARTLALLADPATRPDDLTRPGHVVATATRPGRGDTADVASALAELAGLAPVGVLCTLLDEESGELLDAVTAAAFARVEGLVDLAVTDLIPR
ncbi:3,4-dihydroxy-2-butanone-4-phosphate synthase [Actinomycetospora soli]|uniref:3,4-dihydroxy-2-butanone-4-phosphate synthase n=1 Tax=Actinomycetospora soli TaxID=2893887 RepID=UPI001E3C6B62|nr:3,4-dihydroxy-2-butanone-4-phosphate synthase [Actinomycetospora soli]MCD2185732.1 3,4-dihydroxy-2-butanone-4-phosphate synthase [Actinomycetospora soli]